MLELKKGQLLVVVDASDTSLGSIDKIPFKEGDIVEFDSYNKSSFSKSEDYEYWISIAGKRHIHHSWRSSRFVVYIPNLKDKTNKKDLDAITKIILV